METMLRIESEMVKVFRIKGAKGGYDWANIYLTVYDSAITVLVHSSFGTFSHHWSNTGGDPIAFLMGLEKSYALTKFQTDLRFPRFGELTAFWDHVWIPFMAHLKDLRAVARREGA